MGQDAGDQLQQVLYSINNVKSIPDTPAEQQEKCLAKVVVSTTTVKYSTVQYDRIPVGCKYVR